ncbi:MAG: DUF4430 domain-containing protein [Candidatus Yanofskybacteria bacterium]|nr:DUF4430 domain-containing protein [Candidatus Yanofskybacteria bacterium]
MRFITAFLGIVFLAAGFGGIALHTVWPSAKESNLEIREEEREDILIEESELVGQGFDIVGQQKKRTDIEDVPYEKQAVSYYPAYPVITLTVEGKEYLVPAIEEITVLEAMRIAEGNGFRFSGKDFFGIGFFVEEIEGRRQDPGKQMYWVYSIDGQKARMGVSQQKVVPGNIIEWTYEKSY